MYTVKKVRGFPVRGFLVPSRDVTNQTLARNNLIIPSRLGTGKPLPHFYSVLSASLLNFLLLLLLNYLLALGRAYKRYKFLCRYTFFIHYGDY